MLEITSLYAAVSAFIFIVLSVLAIRQRRADRKILGEDGSPELLRRVRAHGNFAEYVPMALILLALVENMGGGLIWVHLLGITLIFGRVAHALSLRKNISLRLRVIGMACTFSMIAASALSLLILILLG